jgi:hypothetical protein
MRRKTKTMNKTEYYSISEAEHEAVKEAWLKAGDAGANLGIIQRNRAWELKGYTPDGEYVSRLANTQNTIEYLWALVSDGKRDC